MIDKTLNIPIYDCEVRVQVTHSYEEFEEAVFETGFSDSVDSAGMITLRYDTHPKLFHVIINEDDISPGNIAHEALHVTNKIMSVTGVKYDDDNDEAMCYLLGFITDGITQIIS